MNQTTIAFSITKARAILGTAEQQTISDEELHRMIYQMESLSEVIINEVRSSKNKSVVDFIALMSDNEP